MTGPHHNLTETASDAAIDTACRVLRLPTMRAQFPDLVACAERERLSYRGFLAELLMSECEDRDRRRSERRIRAAGFPRQKWLALSGVSVKEPCKVAVQEVADASERRLRFALCPVGSKSLSCWSGASVGSSHDCRRPAHTRVVPTPPSDQRAQAGISVAGSCLD
ncbi:hypothetical protein GCM10010326_00800 [Streptomyces xanthochromogenes]|uniref:IstB-like ATP-binding domain-containing protein n=1 Tax=Streptomyces xanthochromogenes TaxID=67384 RepID=A0ABQ2ZGB9_9ACTN|nr:hypothetical protein GCM10010326_00800 [Streptomyces xanthochromogenes]